MSRAERKSTAGRGLVALAFAAWILGAAGVAGAARDQDADLLYERGARAMRQGDFTTAVDTLARAVQLAPEDAETIALYAQALLGAGRADEALAQVERLRRVSPAFPELPLVSGMTYSEQGQWPQARDQLVAATQRDPSNARAHLLLGVAYHELNEFDAAERELHEAARLDPGLRDEVDYRLGLLQLARNQGPSARDFFEQVQSRDPNSPLGQSASAFLAALEGRAGKPWSVFATIGTQWDSNVTVGGGDEDLAVSREDDFRFITELGGDYQLVDNEYMSLAMGGSGAMSFQTEVEDFDQERLRGWTLLAAKLHPKLRADLRYGYEQFWVDYDGFRRTHTVEPGLRFRLNESLMSRLYYRYESRQYSVDDLFPEVDRDGYVQTAGGEQYFYLRDPFGFGPGYVRVGYEHRMEFAEGSNYDSRGDKALGTLGFLLPDRYFLILDASYERRQYDEAPNVFDPFLRGQSAKAKGARDDGITEARLILRRPIGENVVLEGGYRYYNQNSNIPFYDYDRHIFHIHATYRY